MWSCRHARIDQGDLELVLAVALDGQRAPHREVDDRGRGLSGIDLAVDQQAGLCDRDLRRRERDRDGDIGVVRHDLAFLTGKRNHSRRQARVALIAAVLAPPQHANNRRADRDEK